MQDYEYIVDCYGTVQIDPLPSSDEMQVFYANKYYQEGTLQYTGSYSKNELEYFRISPKLMMHCMENHGVIDGKVLDIGCGEGYQLAVFDEFGFGCYGADFSISGIEQQNPELLSKIKFQQCDIVNDKVFPDSTFDVIVANNVFEHVIDMDLFIKKFARLCHDQSLIFIQVPNEQNPFQENRMKRLGQTLEEQHWFAPPEHLRYFTPDSLKKTMQGYGFDCLTMYGDFPVDMFLLEAETDYYTTGFGKTAHALRVGFSNLMSRDISAYAKYSEALVGMGIGRDIIGVFRKSKTTED